MRGQPAPRRRRSRIGGSHRFEQRDEMLAGGLLVPFVCRGAPVRERFDGAVAIAFGIECQRQIVARLMIVRIDRELGRQNRMSPSAPAFRESQFGFDRAHGLVPRTIGMHELQVCLARSRSPPLR